MRYRPLGSSGSAVSCLTLGLGPRALTHGPQAAQEMIFSALEGGINNYVLQTADPVVAEVVGQALNHIDRRLVGVTLTLGTGDGKRGSERDFSAEGITHAIDRALHVSGLGWFDTAILRQPEEEELPQQTLDALKALRATGRIKMLGISGSDPVMDAYVSTGAFDTLLTPFHPNVDWRVQTRVRNARQQDMAVLAYDYFPKEMHTAKDTAALHGTPKKGLFSFGTGKRNKHDPLAGTGTFAFLHQTPNWSAQAICLAHALTDPTIASVVVHANTPEELATLIAVPERDLPPGLSAQIEMARVSSANKAAA